MKELICIFDINETLLDLKVLDSWFIKVFGKKEFRLIWFKTVLHTSLVLNVIDSYQEFKIIAEASLHTLAEQFQIELDNEKLSDFQKQMKSLPLHADVKKGLLDLKQAGYRMIALSNSSQNSVLALLREAGVLEYFESCKSTDSVKKFKPDHAPYNFVVNELGAVAKNIWMIAAHAWDTSGAKKAGFKSALILREAHGQNKLFLAPDVQGLDLPTVAQLIIEIDKLA